MLILIKAEAEGYYSGATFEEALFVSLETLSKISKEELERIKSLSIAELDGRFSETPAKVTFELLTKAMAVDCKERELNDDLLYDVVAWTYKCSGNSLEEFEKEQEGIHQFFKDNPSNRCGKVKTPKLTDEQRIELMYMKQVKGMEWFAKDKSGSIWFFEHLPTKNLECKEWFSGTPLFVGNVLDYSFVKWEDSKPWNIVELLEEDGIRKLDESLVKIKHGG